ncbi:hypothetical protein [Mucilaginibacter pedocola]|uniref:DUF4142 domain-containing protein n=1 Tax=Mucilaginibacter pedocola TaxID=1792845 RepID=A0A1S9PGE8_9SPHI|nr:hypothetical protein [Mucilaginibacter pedocola]OOQ60016.1 hypothetical protein BC343_27185 [Mucilaginibacter pedocola]
MKTKLFLLPILFTIGLTAGGAKAQSFSFGDLFGQQGKKEKLMAVQVGGIYIYLAALKGGYNIMHKGLDLADELKGGTFGLHTGYFNSLEQVSPVVQQNPKGKAITGLYNELSNRLNSETSWQKKQQQLKPAELAYLEKVAANLVKLAGQDMAELNELLTPGKLQLTDQQRLDRLDKLYAAMKDKAAFAASFAAKSRSLAQNRQRAKAENEQIRKLYGNPHP